MKKLTEFKHDVKTAILAYAIQKAGGIQQLASHRSVPCNRIIVYLTHTTDDWQTIKRLLRQELAQLKTGLLGRSALRQRMTAVLQRPCYSDEAFLQAALKIKTNEIIKLKQALRRHEKQQTVCELRARIQQLHHRIDELAEENENLKHCYHDLNTEHSRLQQALTYQEEDSPTHNLLDNYESFSVGSDCSLDTLDSVSSCKH